MEPKAQCKVCLSYWDVGIVYCTCGQFLRNENEENKKYVKYTMDVLSFPNYYIKIGRHHGHRYGKKPGDRAYYIANSLKKRCKKRGYLGIHDRFIREEKFRQNMYDVGRDEEMCREMDKTGGRGPHEPPQFRRISSIFIELVDSFEHSWFRYDARKASTWFQNKHCLPCDSSRTKKIQLISKDGKILHPGGAGKDHGGLFILMKITKKTSPVLIDQGNPMAHVLGIQSSRYVFQKFNCDWYR